MKALLNWRYWVLTALGCASVILMCAAFGEPGTDITVMRWLLTAAAELACSLAGMALTERMAKRWMRRGLLPELERAMRED